MRSTRMLCWVMVLGLLVAPVAAWAADSEEDAKPQSSSSASSGKDPKPKADVAGDEKSESAKPAEKSSADASLKTLEDIYCSLDSAALLLQKQEQASAQPKVQWREIR